MTVNLWLKWAGMAVSLANVMAMLWLGLTVLLNSSRRPRQVWLTGGGLLLGGLFFVSHTAILGYGPAFSGPGLEIWWRLGWLPLVGLPFIWFGVMLWYTGGWPDGSRLPRPRAPFWLLLAWGAGLLLWLGVGRPLPSFAQVVQLKLTGAAAIAGVPLFLALYALYIVLCTALALALLFRPAAAATLTADVRHRRTRAGLTAAAAALVAVSWLAAGAIGWAALLDAAGLHSSDISRLTTIAAGIDLLVSGLIAVTVALLGQAAISFEIFSDQTLPRREFQRQWTNVIILAVGYSTVTGGALALEIRPVGLLLAGTLLLVLFLALSHWRSHTWRERYLRQLRPLMTSQRLFDRLLAASPVEFEAAAPLVALCQDVLQAQSARLLPLGSLAPLLRPLAYPSNQIDLPASLPPKLLAQLHTPAQIAVPLAAGWAIPLWSERGLIGVLLLGPKQSGGLYAQEEMEIARAAAERLIDTYAITEIARRLMDVQRQRLVESRLMDQQTRRVLHDEVLPNLHTVLLSLSGADSDTAKLLAETHGQIANLLQAMPAAAPPELERLGLAGALRRLVDSELAGQFNSVEWQIEPEAAQRAAELAPLNANVLFYAAREMMRNAAKHGRGSNPAQPLSLQVRLALGHGLRLEIEDNGAGIAQTNSNGAGQGLALHSTMLAVIGGELSIDSGPGRTRVAIRLPL